MAEPLDLHTGTLASAPGTSGAIDWSGPVTLALQPKISVAGATPFKLSGDVVGDAFAGDGELHVVGSSTGSLEFRNGAKNFAGTTIIESGRVVVNSSVSNGHFVVGPAGTLTGSSQVGSVDVEGGTLSPGAPLGTLTAGSVSFDADPTFQVELNADAAKGARDRLKAMGPVTLGGRLLVADGFGSTVGTSFTIIDVAGTQPVTGTFDGLPEGATMPVTQVVFDPGTQQFTALTQLLQITYAGGTGNDVVLTHINTKTTAEDLQLTTLEQGHGALVQLSGRLTDPDLHDRLTLTIDWGDGARVQTFHPGRKSFDIPHRYRAAGTYTIRVTWFDEHGQGNSRDLTVSIDDPTSPLGRRWSGSARDNASAAVDIVFADMLDEIWCNRGEQAKRS
jgi:hypothetical protein